MSLCNDIKYLNSQGISQKVNRKESSQVDTLSSIVEFVARTRSHAGRAPRHLTIEAMCG